ncbi:MAG: trypsin-like peptidase domain-containing protein [Rhodospirillales bacterium]|nr:trypsin-like peptidase domain-containing protein [Rhodospirillales bacterium]
MLQRLGRGLTFIAGSIVGGLALAFVIVALHPSLIRGPARSPQRTAPPAPAPAAAAPVPERLPPLVSYAAAVQRAAPAVVNIYTDRVVTERISPFPFGELFGNVLPEYRQRIERSLGSGVIVDAQGHIVTNYHVIANAAAIRVQLADGRIAVPRIVGVDRDTDLAVLQISLPNLPVIHFGRSDQVRVGDVVLAIGNPLGLSQTVTHGIVSATGRADLGISTFEDFIQTDAPINFGNSGGALVNSDGQLIGINTAIVAKSLGVEGIGFAIPVDMVRGVLRDIIKYGKVIRGWIGIVPEDISDAQARQAGLERGGVVIANLYAGSPAQLAGLKPGDLLLAIDGLPVRSAEDARARIARDKPGATITLRVLRGSATRTLTVRVKQQPAGL